MVKRGVLQVPGHFLSAEEYGLCIALCSPFFVVVILFLLRQGWRSDVTGRSVILSRLSIDL